MPTTVVHPLTAKLGISIQLQPDSRLVYSPVHGKETQWKYAHVHLSEESGLEFSIRDDQRNFSASFNSAGQLTSLVCSTGIPSGDTASVIEMFFEEARLAIQNLELLH